jgi:hypothetical protein
MEEYFGQINDTMGRTLKGSRLSKPLQLNHALQGGIFPSTYPITAFLQRFRTNVLIGDALFSFKEPLTAN